MPRLVAATERHCVKLFLTTEYSEALVARDEIVVCRPSFSE